MEEGCSEEEHHTTGKRDTYCYTGLSVRGCMDVSLRCKNSLAYYLHEETMERQQRGYWRDVISNTTWKQIMREHEQRTGKRIKGLTIDDSRIVPLTVGDERLVPLTCDDKDIVPLTVEDDRIVPLSFD